MSALFSSVNVLGKLYVGNNNQPPTADFTSSTESCYSGNHQQETTATHEESS